MKLTVRINDLIDQHGDTFTICKGCSICREIQSLNKQLVKSDVPKAFRKLLEKGEDMTKSDIAVLIEGGVAKRDIRKALGYSEAKFSDLIKAFGFSRGYEMEGEELDLTAEQYLKMKEQGLKDEQIADRLGVKAHYLRNWKYKNGIKAGRAPKQPIIDEVKPIEGKTTQEDKQAELRELINELSDSLNKERETNKALENQIQSLTEERDHYRGRMVVGTVEENLKKTIERYAEENKALRELVKLWI
jgi:transcriptional regulator with XRE-family HTH domain